MSGSDYHLDVQSLGVNLGGFSLRDINLKCKKGEYHILLGFTAGLLVDLVGSGTLGLWAMTFTIIAYASSRLRPRMVQSSIAMGAIVFGLTIAAQMIFVLMSTIFGQNTIAEPQLLPKILLPAVWNLALAYPLMWLLKRVFKPAERGWAV